MEVTAEVFSDRIGTGSPSMKLESELERSGSERRYASLNRMQSSEAKAKRNA